MYVYVVIYYGHLGYRILLLIREYSNMSWEEEEGRII
jgi:hypothetical protein